jgi:hypothetical protein
LPLVTAAAFLLAQYRPDGGGADAFLTEARRVALPIGAFAFCWSALTGLPGVFHLNSDWYVRLEVLHAFSRPDWRSYYDGNRHFLLRFPGAYYALVAPFSEHVSMGVSRMLLWGFTAFVATLALGALFNSGLRMLVLFLFAMFAANGLDVVGVLALQSTAPLAGAHIEWWSGQQYSGLTTDMIWVPNHLLPALLFVATLPLRRPSVSLHGLGRVALAAAGTILWSPLVFAGTVPIVLMLALQRSSDIHWSEAIRRRLFAFWLPLALVSFAAILYVTYLTGATHRGWSLSFCTDEARLCRTKMAWFYALEAFPLALPCLALPHRRIGLACATTLLVLPLLYFGPSNDLEMRGSLPAIIVSTVSLCLFVERHAARAVAVSALVLLLGEGYGALSEVTRGIADFDQPTWHSAGFGETFRVHFPWNLVNGYPPHYMMPFAEACGGVLGGALRGCNGTDRN